MSVPRTAIPPFHYSKKSVMLFDLVVTDINMSEMSGLELVLKIKALRPDIPIILCTGLGEIPDETETAKLGIRGYLTKTDFKTNALGNGFVLLLTDPQKPFSGTQI